MPLCLHLIDRYSKGGGDPLFGGLSQTNLNFFHLAIGFLGDTHPFGNFFLGNPFVFTPRPGKTLVFQNMFFYYFVGKINLFFWDVLGFNLFLLWERFIMIFLPDRSAGCRG